MFYLIIHLENEEYEQELLLAMASAGILDAIVLPGTSAREMMAGALPIFAGFRADLTRRGNYAKLIAAIVPDDHAVDRILEALHAADIDFIGKNIGSMILLPVARVVDADYGG
ncbi:MAG TPA: hypothetical protein VM186_09105 [Planctomycetota bacterium]|nr:hypothetical protein [Planctomycetota bacterium]